MSESFILLFSIHSEFLFLFCYVYFHAKFYRFRLILTVIRKLAYHHLLWIINLKIINSGQSRLRRVTFIPVRQTFPKLCFVKCDKNYTNKTPTQSKPYVNRLVKRRSVLIPHLPIQSEIIHYVSATADHQKCRGDVLNACAGVAAGESD